MSRVLVTGARGFVGSVLCRSLVSAGHNVVGTTRQKDACNDAVETSFRLVHDSGSGVECKEELSKSDCVVHLAARVHVMNEMAADPIAEFRAANLEKTESLARNAAAEGIKRFVFVSTIKVLGDGVPHRPYTHSDRASPSDAYSVSKYEAEQAVERIASETGMEFVILRPPLIYGAGVGGNMRRIFSLVYRGIPMPFGAVENARSMLAVENLCDVIQLCLERREASGKVFLVADDTPISTPQLIRTVAANMGKSARLLPIPVSVLKVMGKLTGRAPEISRLCESLLVDVQYTQEMLDWTARVSPEEGLRTAVERFIEDAKQNHE